MERHVEGALVPLDYLGIGVTEGGGEGEGEGGVTDQVPPELRGPPDQDGVTRPQHHLGSTGLVYREG